MRCNGYNARPRTQTPRTTISIRGNPIQARRCSKTTNGTQIGQRAIGGLNRKHSDGQCGAMRVTGEAPCTRGDSLGSMARDFRAPELHRPSVNSSAKRRKLQRDVSWRLDYQLIRRGPSHAPSDVGINMPSRYQVPINGAASSGRKLGCAEKWPDRSCLPGPRSASIFFALARAGNLCDGIEFCDPPGQGGPEQWQG